MLRERYEETAYAEFKLYGSGRACEKSQVNVKLAELAYMR